MLLSAASSLPPSFPFQAKFKLYTIVFSNFPQALNLPA